MPFNKYELCFRKGNELHYLPKGYFDKLYFPNDTEDKDETYPAYTVAELGEMLPTYYDGVGMYKTIKDVGAKTNDKSNHDVEGWSISQTFPEDGYEMVEHVENGIWDTEAEARAAMLIHLLESKLITPEQCATNLSH
jgi:hypothetical protein